MAINKQLIHFRSKTNFAEQSSQGNILNTSICFIQDSKEISTHETIYKSVNWCVLDHPYVDLGLPSGTLWASYNVGSNYPSDYGSYFAWGESEIKNSYSENTSITYNLSSEELQSRDIIDSNGNLTAEYDAATINWGNGWRMPTEVEVQELINKCTWLWAYENGISGCKIIGPNGNHIFLPASGYCGTSSSSDVGSIGYIWSSTVPTSTQHGTCFYFNSSSFAQYSYGYRFSGRTIRPVKQKQ